MIKREKMPKIIKNSVSLHISRTVPHVIVVFGTHVLGGNSYVAIFIPFIMRSLKYNNFHSAHKVVTQM